MRDKLVIYDRKCFTSDRLRPQLIAYTPADRNPRAHETDYAARTDGGSVVFREPQLNAWYRLADGQVVPLNEEARASVGAGGTGLASYQRLVHQRYADKMPGSAYDEGGYAGGYATGAGRARVAADAHTGSEATDTTPVVAGVGARAFAVAGVAGGVLVRRRWLAGR
ncbi:hypothetical protein [Streptomyces rubrogriseus]|uniref:Uncharacterized protein n=1 Tax=Streptomyces rubrogriseus TaxID=194673 RepID=A0ABT4P8Q1_9ACTN|nr:hypothetical protein [Streptomyces rubrogriseus]MCZ4637469.1 hypothetical protein [Streptomyces rubrogriseus]BDD74820.1 hypothetical protein JCM4020_54400 [Streptomyces coelicolor]